MRKKKSSLVVVVNLLIIICLLVCLIVGYNVVSIVEEYNVGTKEYDRLQEVVDSIAEPSSPNIQNVMNATATNKNPIDFKKLQSVNDDIRAWIVMPGIGISYPIVQGNDNDEYLHSTFYKTYNFAGCLFIDANCKDGLNGFNCIIYGHNMKNGSMFGKLKDYTDQNFCLKNQNFYVFMSNQVREYQIFNVAYVNQIDDAYNVPQTEEENFDYLKMMTERGLFSTGVSVGKADRTVTLSTCTTEASTRLVIQGKIVAVRNF